MLRNSSLKALHALIIVLNEVLSLNAQEFVSYWLSVALLAPQ